MNGVNLIPVVRQEARRRRHRQRRWLLATCGYAALLFALCVILRSKFGVDNHAIANELSRTATRTKEVKEQVNAIQKRIVEAQTTVETIRTVSDQPDWSVLMAGLGQLVADDTVLRSVRIEPMAEAGPAAAPVKKGKPEPKKAPVMRKVRLQLQGLSATQAAVSQFVKRLQETELFDEVKLIRTSREPFRATEAVAFSVQCVLSEKTKP